MRGCVFLNATKPETDIERGGFPRFRPEPDGMEHALGMAEQLPHEGSAHAGASGRLPNIKVPQPPDPVLAGIGIAVEAANRDQIVRPAGRQTYLARFGESVRA
jgi:hypothetical protein